MSFNNSQQVWAASANVTHNSPTDLVWKNQNSWGTGDLIQTTLISANGEVRPYLHFFTFEYDLLSDVRHLSPSSLLGNGHEESDS